MENNIYKAHGKINLHLQVLNKRGDGFHNIFSLMAELSVFDLLKLQFCDFDYRAENIEIDIISGGGVYPDIVSSIPVEDNLITMAAKNYLSSIGAGGKFCFEIEKNLPAGAGLGGGSSDAAAALKLIRDALGRGDDEILLNSAAATGSDVPFFLQGGLAFAQGRGEILEQVNRKISGNIVLVNNGVQINTGLAYRDLNRDFDESAVHAITNKKSEILGSLDAVDEWKEIFKNDFEDTVFRVHPELNKIKESIYDLGARFSAMTGSGSTVFGVFSDSCAAEEAVSLLKKQGNRVFLSNFA